MTYFNSCCTTLLLLPFISKGVRGLWLSGRLAQITSASALIEELDSINGLGPAHASNREAEAGSFSSSFDNTNRPLLNSSTSLEPDVSDLPKRKLSPGDDVQQLEFAEDVTPVEGRVASLENGKLGIEQTARLSLEFCILWVSWNASTHCSLSPRELKADLSFISSSL